MPYSIKHLSNQFSYFIYFGWYFLVLAKLVFLSLLSPSSRLLNRKSLMRKSVEPVTKNIYLYMHIAIVISYPRPLFSNAVPPDYVNIVWNIYFFFVVVLMCYKFLYSSFALSSCVMYTAYGGAVYVYTPLAYLKNGKQSKFHFFYRPFLTPSSIQMRAQTAILL